MIPDLLEPILSLGLMFWGARSAVSLWRKHKQSEQIADEDKEAHERRQQHRAELVEFDKKLGINSPRGLVSGYYEDINPIKGAFSSMQAPGLRQMLGALGCPPSSLMMQAQQQQQGQLFEQMRQQQGQLFDQLRRQQGSVFDEMQQMKADKELLKELFRGQKDNRNK